MTEYEQLRENNIARNQEFLRSLGLSDNNDLVKKEAKRQKKKRRHDDDFTESEEESRRRRLRTAPTRATLTRGAKEKIQLKGYAEDRLNVAVSPSRAREGVRRSARAASGKSYREFFDSDVWAVNDDDDEDASAHGNDSVDSKSVPAADSLGSPQSTNPQSSMRFTVDAVKLAPLLGKHLTPAVKGGPGKAAAMYAIAQSERVAFSKMSGVQQFANATALFVNIGGSQNYDNAFDKSTGDDAGMSITWFAQRRHKPTTAVIVRMMKKDAIVLLCCRTMLPSPSPYVYCGTLSLDSVDMTTAPMTFHWRLNDIGTLSQSSLFAALLATKTIVEKDDESREYDDDDDDDDNNNDE